MKKTLITLAALALASVASAADYTFTVPVNGECTDPADAVYAGDFEFNFMIHSADDVSTEGTWLAYYRGEASGYDSVHSQQSYILTKVGNDTDGYSFTLSVGRSNYNIDGWGDGAATVVYTGLQIGVDYEVINRTSGSKMYTGLAADGVRIDFADDADDFVTHEGKINGNSQALLNAATMTTSFNQTFAVPEPATATLSLLALAGLAARRRRK